MELNAQKTYCVSNKVISVILKSRNNCNEGYIGGLEDNNTVYCIAATASKDHLLTGLQIIGIYCLVHDTSLSENDHAMIRKYLEILKIEYQNPVVLLINKAESGGDTHVIPKVFNTDKKTLCDIDVTYSNPASAMLLRAIGQIPISFETSSDTDVMNKNIASAVKRLTDIVKNSMLAFLMEDSSRDITLFANYSETQTCGNLYSFCQNSELYGNAKKYKNNLKKQKPIEFRILVQCTGDTAVKMSGSEALVLHSKTGQFQRVSLCLPLDVLVICLESTPVSTVYYLFTNAIQKQLEIMSTWMQNWAKDSEFITPVPFHFYPDVFEVPLTIIYPSNKTDEKLEECRKILQKLLLLPMDRPFIRKLNKYEFSAESPYLINPHEGLSPSGVSGGRTSIVHGRYSYHHYMQDHINDSGWGCAYRSLQTIISWFKFQGYTDKPIPTHKEIQQTLVDIHDKPESFVGSTSWIGSQEVSHCLNHLIQVESRILCVSTGAEMCDISRNLFNHFEDQGTPVMIGGGQYAHTILGVDFHDKTGEVKFLILDPHYTGGEDLKIIQNKGWCGWKGINFWNKTAFYNLCLPLRPQVI